MFSAVCLERSQGRLHFLEGTEAKELQSLAVLEVEQL